MTESGRRAVTSAKVKLFSIYSPYDRIVFNRSPVDARMFFPFSAVRPWANGVFSNDSIGAKSCSKAFLSR